MRKRTTVSAILLVLSGITLAALAASQLTVFNRPHGLQVGTWSGPVEILVVQGDWVRVRMTGWLPKAQVAPTAPTGTKLEGSPGGGIWVTGLALGPDVLGFVRVTGWITNATGRDIETLTLGVVLLRGDGSLVEVFPELVWSVPDGSTKAFSSTLPFRHSPFFKVLLQYESSY